MKFSMDLRRLINQDNNIVQLIVMTILIFAIMTVLSPDKFLRYYNFESIAYIFPELGLLSIAMMIAMLTGGIDLSVIGIARPTWAARPGSSRNSPMKQVLPIPACRW